MPPVRFAPPTEVPGLAARRIAADILDGVLHKRRTLDDQLEGGGAHPGLKTLSDRDRALMRRLVATIPGIALRAACDGEAPDRWYSTMAHLALHQVGPSLGSVLRAARLIT